MKPFLLVLLFILPLVVSDNCVPTTSQTYTSSFLTVSQLELTNPLGIVTVCYFDGTAVEVEIDKTNDVVATVNFYSQLVSVEISSGVTPVITSSASAISLFGSSFFLFLGFLISLVTGRREAFLIGLIPAVLAATSCATVTVRVPSSTPPSSILISDSQGTRNTLQISPCIVDSTPSSSSTEDTQPLTTAVASTGIPTTGIPTTSIPTTGIPTTGVPTTGVPTTRTPTTGIPTTGIPTTGIPTTGIPTTGVPTTRTPTTGIPTTGIPTTGVPTTRTPTTGIPTTGVPTTRTPTTGVATTKGTTTGVSTTTGAAFPGCNCVAFRLDDIQDYFISAAQISVVNTFQTLKLPMTIGIIANYFGTDPDMVSLVTTAIAPNAPSVVEVVSHGYNHEDFTTFNLSQQINLLTLSKQKINNVTGVLPNVFVPPFNSFNTNTETALVNTGYVLMSSEVGQDPPPYPLNHPSLYRFPIGAQTSYVDANGYYRALDHTSILNQIYTQLGAQGYSAIMMHPQEFINFQNGNYGTTTNQTQINELKLVIQALQAKGVQFVTLGNLPSQNFGAETQIAGTYSFDGQGGKK